jgi:hypothetical protein
MFYYNYYKRLFKTYAKVMFNNSKPKILSTNYLDLGIIDPSIGTSNLGDLIILDAVISELRKKYPEDLFTHYPAQIHTSYDAKKLMNTKDHLFIAGTNLLSSDMQNHYQWCIDPMHKLFIRHKAILVGVGWWQYQSKPNKYTAGLLKKILSNKYLHSVRDSYTYNKLVEIGITNVVNTSCPTLWGINAEICKQIPINKAKNVVTTLTCYDENPELDRKLLKILLNNYENVYLWVQGLDDVKYLNNIFPEGSRIQLIPPTIAAYNKILDDKTIEYIGSRLHAGIRSLQRGLRTMIIAVDNRALEIAKDTNLNVINRNNLDPVMTFINSPYFTDIKLPLENIEKWRSNLPIKEQ